MRSIAREFMLNGAISREGIEWHEGRHDFHVVDLFDQLMDDCAGEMTEVGDESGDPWRAPSPLCEGAEVNQMETRCKNAILGRMRTRTQRPGGLYFKERGLYFKE
eukprot:104879-Amphidinium_carterae.1